MASSKSKSPLAKSPLARVTKLRDGASEEQGDNVAKINGQHVGDILRQARETRGMTLDMVADELMIRRFYLDALEAGSFHDLPERVYATGFVRSYATYVGLDPVQTAEQFRRDAYGARGAQPYQTELVMPEPVIHSVMPGRSAIIAGIVILGLAIAGGVIVMRDKAKAVNTIPSAPEMTDITDQPVGAPIEAPAATPNEQGSEEGSEQGAEQEGYVPPVVEAPNDAQAAPTLSSGFDAPETPAASATGFARETTNTNATANVGANLPAPTGTANLPNTDTNSAATNPATNTAAPTKGMTIEALESSWVEVKDAKGTVLFTNILKKGQLLPIPNQTGITLTTGNAGGLRAVLDGKPLSPLGQLNEVKRNVSLDAISRL